MCEREHLINTKVVRAELQYFSANFRRYKLQNAVIFKWQLLLKIEKLQTKCNSTGFYSQVDSSRIIGKNKSIVQPRNQRCTVKRFVVKF